MKKAHASAEKETGIIHLEIEVVRHSGKEWISLFEGKDIKIGSYAKSLLESKDFTTSAEGTKKIAIIKGSMFPDYERRTVKILDFGLARKFKQPCADIACQLRKALTDEKISLMGIHSIIGMHEPIKDSANALALLGLTRLVVVPTIGAYYFEKSWNTEAGFVFEEE